MSRDFLIHNGKLTSDLDADGNQIKNLPGVAHLVDGKVPSDELPSYVDDVLEYATLNDFPVTGTEGKIYVAKDTNKTYRWSGTQYTEIANPTLDNAVTKNSANGVKSSGIWSAIWGALSALPTGFTSLYDWCVAQLAGKASKSDATLTERFSEWGTTTDMSPTEFLKILILYGDAGGGVGWYPLVIRVCSTGIDDIDALRLEYAASDSALGVPVVATRQTTQSAWILKYDYEGYYHHIGIYWKDGYGWCIGASNHSYDGDPKGSVDSTELSWTDDWTGASKSYTLTATRTALQGYVLGSQTDKPLASEAEAEALRTAVAGKQSALTAQQLANIAAVPGKLDKSGGTMTGDLTFEDGHGAGVCFNRSGGYKSELFYDGAGDVLEVLTTDGNGSIVSDIAIPTTGYGVLALTADIPYDRITITTGQLQDHAVQKVTLNAATTTLSLPALTDLTGKVSDFGIDMVNGYAPSGTPTAASFSLAGTIGTDYNIIVPEGEDWSEMSALAAGEMAQFYFTLSAFAINDKPTWKIVKQVVELVPVPSAP